MQPRLKSSVKWTKLPQDVSDQIRDLFKQNFQKELANSQVIVEGRIYKQEILLRVGYLEAGRLTQTNFEISMEYKLNNQESALNTIHLCVDAAGAVMAEHFDSEDGLELPYTWTEFPFEGRKVWLQFSTTNTNLEKQANELLGEWNDSLVQGEVEDAMDVGEEDQETASAEVEVEVSDPDDDDDSNDPKGTLH